MFRCIVNRESLLEAVTFAARVALKNHPKPLLSCVKIGSNDAAAIEVVCTNLENAVVSIVRQVQVESIGSICIPAHKLVSILKSSESDTVLIEESEGAISIRDNDSAFELFTLPVAEFPATPEPIEGTSVTIQAADLASMIGRTAFATAKESTRYAFNGMLVGMNGDFRLVATDGRRMAVVHHEATKTGDDAKTIANGGLIALAGILSKACKGDEITVTIEAAPPTEKSVRRFEFIPRVEFRCGDDRIVGTSLDGTFPPYEDVIPKDADRTCIVGTEELTKAVKRASLMTSSESKGMRMVFAEGKPSVISSSDPRAGKASIQFYAAYKGASLEIGFNPDFLGDALKVCGTDEVELKFTAPNRPLLMEARTFRYVLMPVNLPA